MSPFSRFGARLPFARAPFSRLPGGAAAVSIAGLAVLAGCRARGVEPHSSSRAPAGAPSSTETDPAARGDAPVVRDAVVRAISRPVGATVLVAEVAHHRVAIVADEEESAVQLVDLETRTVTSTTRLDGAPGQMLLAPNGTLFVAVRGAGRVVLFRFREDGAAHAVASHVTAEEPFGLALTPDGSTALVSTITDPGIEALRASDLISTFRIPLPRDPRSITVSSDGARAFVTHATGSLLSAVELTGAAPGRTRAIALDARELRRDFGMPRITKPQAKFASPDPWGDSMPGFVPPPPVQISMKRSANQGFAVASLGERLFLPETLVMTSDSESPPSGYGAITQSTLSTHVPFVARVRIEDETLENPELSGPADKACFETKAECLLPRAVTDDGIRLYVACLDSDEVMVIDPGKDAEHAPACRQTLAKRERVRVKSPTGVAFDRERQELVVFSELSRTLSVASLGASPAGERALAEVALPRSSAVPARVAAGRALFHRSAEPRLARNGRACASCHVDGRDDALVWPTPSGKRQTPMLAGRVDRTAPYGWNGEHATLDVHITSTVKNLEGSGIGAEEREALAAYVASIRLPARRAAGAETVARGEAVFRSQEAGCASCHLEEMRFTDLETHVLASASGRAGAGAPAFDTPSLAFVGQTAPYFHDGRFATLEELVEGCEEPRTNMGHTRHLPAEDRRALVAYLKSL